jgi:hypothetical protein
MSLLLAVAVAHRAESQAGCPDPRQCAERSIVATEPRVRLRYATAGEMTTVIGYLHAADSATVVLRNTSMGGRIDVPRHAINSSELSAGTRRHGGRGFGLGLVGGALLAGSIAGIAQPSSGGNADRDIRGLAVIGSGLFGALAGSVIGAIIGWHVSTERWTPYQLPARDLP